MKRQQSPGHRGGRRRHEPRRCVQPRDVQVLEMIAQGKTQHQMAAALGISQPAVSKRVRRLEDRLLKEFAVQTEQQRARHTLRLEHLFSEAMTAWQGSKADALRRRQRKTEAGTGVNTTIAELVSENRDGDPRYLEVARKALADLRAVWGLDAPAQVTVDATTRFALMAPADLEAELAWQTKLLGESATPSKASPVTSGESEERHDA